jgi:hypothetical protein
MDISHLHTFDVQRPSSKTLDTLKGDTLPALKSLKVKGGRGMDILGFLNCTTLPLEKLELWDIQFQDVYPLLDIVTHPHLHSLHSFALGESENSSPLSRLRLSILLSNSPKMLKLDINLARPELSSTWQQFAPLDPLVENAVELRELTLRFQSPDFYLTRNDRR